jgi:hydroxymethylbilane synthase
MKDIPPDGRWDNSLTIGACLGPREIPLDVLVTKDASIKSIQSLPPGSRVGSASIRRQAQLLAINSSLQVINIRGNVDARLKALDNDEVDALVLAMAGLNRLGVLDETTNTIHQPENRDVKYHFRPLSIEEMLPGLCQGIIGITCRSDNADILSLLKDIDNHDARIAATTERAYLDVVQRVSPWEGRPPLAGYMRRHNSDWRFNALLATPDGAKVLRVEEFVKEIDCNVESAQRLGVNAGEKVLELAGGSFLDGFYSNS